MSDLVLLSCVGIHPVMVHGGGPEINSWLNKLGIEAQFKNGLRVTDGVPSPSMVVVDDSRHTCSAIDSTPGPAMCLHPCAQPPPWTWWRWCWAGA